MLLFDCTWYSWEYYWLTMTPCIFVGRAVPQENLYFLLADGAGQAGVQRALLVRVGVVQTLLTECVVGVLAAHHHTMSAWTHGAQLALVRQVVHEVGVVAHTHSVVGVSAGGSACAWDPCTLYTSDTSLCDWMSQRTSRLEKRDRENSSEWQDNYNLTVCC